MQRWKITIEYEGTSYAGWQRQPKVKTVQGQLMKALKSLFRHNIIVQGAGRTDSGVHATGQVAHFDVEDTFPIGTNFTEFKMCEALNHFLYSEKIAILQAQKVPKDFHARFSATERAYLYRICNRRVKLTFNKNLLWQPKGGVLQAQKMHEAGQVLLGTHDFTTFRAFLSTYQNPVRTIRYLNVKSVDEEIHIEIGAKSFLHNQVRYIVGALQLVGYGHWDKQNIQTILEARDRRKGGPLAPPHGLYLTEVQY